MLQVERLECRYGKVAAVQDLSIEHPSGEFTVRLERDATGTGFASAALLRTARALFSGHVLIEETAS